MSPHVSPLGQCCYTILPLIQAYTPPADTLQHIYIVVPVPSVHYDALSASFPVPNRLLAPAPCPLGPMPTWPWPTAGMTRNLVRLGLVLAVCGLSEGAIKSSGINQVRPRGLG